MKYSLCQINTIVGNLPYNGEKILSFYRRACSQGADLVVFPELATTGYPPLDLLLERKFIEKNIELLDYITEHTTKVPLVIGFVRQEGKKLYNSSAVLMNKKNWGHYDKVLLPTYDVFDEARYFTPGNRFEPISINLNEKEFNLGLQICEDLWDTQYDCKIAEEVAKGNPDIFINLSASPFHEGKVYERMNLIRDKVQKLQIPYFYCNLVGAQDELVFDGNSLAYDAEGKLIGEGKRFQEEILFIELNDKRGIPIEPATYQREKEIFLGLTLGVRDYFAKSGHSKCVIGISGGIDSALTACIAKEALGKENVTCISMPSRFSSQHSIDDAVHLTKRLGVKHLIIPITPLMDCYQSVFEKEFTGFKRDITEENIQARIRGNILMAFSNKLGFLVLSTGNKTELALGYCTLYGDMSGGLAVISDLSKTDVYAVAEWYNEWKGEEIIPKNIFTKIPSAELSEGQVDPFDYSVVSPLVDEIVENHRSMEELLEMGYKASLVEHIYDLVRKAEFKRRQAAPGLRVTSKAFGMGRRYPIINHFDGK